MCTICVFMSGEHFGFTDSESATLCLRFELSRNKKTHNNINDIECPLSVQPGPCFVGKLNRSFFHSGSTEYQESVFACFNRYGCTLTHTHTQPRADVELCHHESAVASPWESSFSKETLALSETTVDKPAKEGRTVFIFDVSQMLLSPLTLEVWWMELFCGWVGQREINGHVVFIKHVEVQANSVQSAVCGCRVLFKGTRVWRWD